MIINLYIESHIWYYYHLYECILQGFCACLKEAWGCTPPLVEYIAIVQHSGYVAARKGYDHVSAVLEYPRGGRSEMDRDPEGQSRGYEMTSLQTVPRHIADIAGIVLLEDKIVFNSLINLQDTWVKDLN